MKGEAEFLRKISSACDILGDGLLGIAIGGSVSSDKSDPIADLDVVVLVAEGALMAPALRLKAELDRLLADERWIVGGPTWKEGFGCRITYLLTDARKVEVFVNTPSTVPRQRRALDWRPISGERHFEELKAEVRLHLTRDASLRRFIFSFAYSCMSISRHVARSEYDAARHVLTTLQSQVYALVIFDRGGDYDPYSSYKRIRRDGLDRLPRIGDARRLAAEEDSPRGFERALRAARAAVADIVETSIGDEATRDMWVRGGEVAAACGAWLQGAGRPDEAAPREG